MIFCKTSNFLQETPDTLSSHVSFINTVFGVDLQKKSIPKINMEWYIAQKLPSLLYMVGHTNDAIQIINRLHSLCAYGIGTQIESIYLNTCTAKPNDETTKNNDYQRKSNIVLSSEATEEEKKKMGIQETRFCTLDKILKIISNDKFRVYICHQDTVTDHNVKMAHFLPMDECGLGFSPTKSEMILYNHKGSLAEKLNDAFDKITEREI
ncbi:MAG: hypothetical protein LBM93_14170 [Oscillospiraceae bacterium]|nr:hypothetical protein [Oscillospiraceae bacterium]